MLLQSIWCYLCSVDADRAIQQNQIPMVFSIYISNFLLLNISTAALPFDLLSCWVNICYHDAITCFWFLIHIFCSDRVFFSYEISWILVMPLRMGQTQLWRYFCLNDKGYNMNIDACMCIHSQTHLHYQSPRVYWCFYRTPGQQLFSWHLHL